MATRISEDEAPTAGRAGRTAGTAVEQVRELLADTLGLRGPALPGARAFVAERAADAKRTAIQRADGQLTDEGMIEVRLELARCPKGARVRAEQLFAALSRLGPRVRLTEPTVAGRDGETSLWVSLLVSDAPMSLSRAAALASELEQLDGLAAAIQAEVPRLVDELDLAKRFAPLEQYVAPVFPFDGAAMAGPEARAWSDETASFLNGGLNVAIAAESEVEQAMGLSLLAESLKASGGALGRLRTPSINGPALLELNGKCPGYLAVPATSLSIGTSPYDLVEAVPALLSALALDRPAVLVGTYARLQSALQPGQGGKLDPLAPVLRKAPSVPRDALVRFAIAAEARKVGGIAGPAEDAAAGAAAAALGAQAADRWARLVGPVAAQAVRMATGASHAKEPLPDFVRRLADLSATTDGIDGPEWRRRPDHIQERFQRRLMDAGLMDHLAQRLYGQDEALAALVARLRSEVLTRDMRQPLRAIAVGAPATGKSAACALLAEWLGVPLVTIDMAAMSSVHQATAQLLGSPPGYVGSFRQGRLEAISGHASGCLVELADLHAAPPDVRCGLADLFLAALDDGTVQTARGVKVPTSSLIMAWTGNLPFGMESKIENGWRFQGPRSRGEVLGRQMDMLREAYSNAFMSRVGTPIVFRTFDDEALAEIMARALIGAARTVAARLGLELAGVELEDGLGARLLPSLPASITSLGVRVAIEHANSCVSHAIRALAADESLCGRVLRLRWADGALIAEAGLRPGESGRGPAA